MRLRFDVRFARLASRSPVTIFWLAALAAAAELAATIGWGILLPKKLLPPAPEAPWGCRMSPKKPDPGPAKTHKKAIHKGIKFPCLYFWIVKIILYILDRN